MLLLKKKGLKCLFKKKKKRPLSNSGSWSLGEKREGQEFQVYHLVDDGARCNPVLPGKWLPLGKWMSLSPGALEATGGWSFWAELEGFSSFNPVAQEEFLVLGLNRVTLQH